MKRPDTQQISYKKRNTVDIYQKSWLLLAFFLFFSCSATEESIPDVSHIPMELSVVRNEKALSSLKTDTETLVFLDENPLLAKTYFRRGQYPHDSVLVKQIRLFLNFSFNDTLLSDVSKIFGDFGTEMRQLKNLFRYIKHYYPAFKVPEVHTMVSGFGSFGFGQDIFVSEELVVIGLDYFAGRTSTYRPKDLPAYIRYRYQPPYIAPSVGQFLSSEFNAYDPGDRSMLAEMIFHGKTLFFMEKMLPHTPDSLLIGYTSKEINASFANEAVVWKYFLEQNLLYETGYSVKNKYVGESPRIQHIDYECPGRIGRWLGWQIVRSLAKNDTLSLQEIMAMKSAKNILKRAKYRPE